MQTKKEEVIKKRRKNFRKSLAEQTKVENKATEAARSAENYLKQLEACVEQLQ